jgi:hypothetical protein
LVVSTGRIGPSEVARSGFRLSRRIGQPVVDCREIRGVKDVAAVKFSALPAPGMLESKYS